MLSTNVLCIKKRKKRSYCIAGGGKTEYGSTSASLAAEKCKRTTGGVNMFHVTENTPPDMLAGAMDLTVHLPNKRSVKMSVERSTPMMDLLVQITTNNHLQLSEYTLEALSMMPSSDHNDSILPFKPNTPIGALDTQHVRVMPKNRTVQVPRNIPVGHQPFESTFRLKVYLPRNQLYVTRVSQSVLLEDIMKKVCEEKNLDPFKYEFRHPGNLDEVLDPKLTLSDYKITEIHVVVKGTGSLNQIFSSSDILALKKEEERKQFHNKTGGGVFNLIFKRGTKQSSGSVSSENRSISPTHSDDSRSVTPPGVQQEIIAPAPAMDRPKPPQRKRRPAPKPPQLDEKPPESKKNENGLTICHSRNSSDSSGYHEASILSDNCNTSLPRRPKSTILPEDGHKLSGEYSQSTSNLSKMSSQSKSTSSLAFPNRKKKSAPPPPPPPVLQSTTLSETETPHEEPSPVVVASQPPVIAQPSENDGNGTDKVIISTSNPVPPRPRPRTKIKPPSPRPRSVISVDLDFSSLDSNKTQQNDISDAKSEELAAVPPITQRIQEEIVVQKETAAVEEIITEEKTENIDFVDSFGDDEEAKIASVSEAVNPQFNQHELIADKDNGRKTKEERMVAEAINSKHNLDKNLQDVHGKVLELQKQNVNVIFNSASFIAKKEEEEEPEKTPQPVKEVELIKSKEKQVVMTEAIPILITDTPPSEPPPSIPIEKETTTSEDIPSVEETDSNEPPVEAEQEKVKPPEVVAFIPKSVKSKSYFDSYTRKRGFQIGKSLIEPISDDDSSISSRNLTSTPNSVASALNAFDFVDEIDDLDINLFTGSLSKNSTSANILRNQLHGMHSLETINKSTSATSLRSSTSIPGFMGSSMKKWDNFEELHDLSSLDNPSDQQNNAWVIGDTSDSESTVSVRLDCPQTPDVLVPAPTINTPPPSSPEKEKIDIIPPPEIPKPAAEDNELEIDWHYKLPDAPQGFRDTSPIPAAVNSADVVDSVVTSPELFEKLNGIKDNQSEKETFSDITSIVSEEDKPILNTLSLENLEKRKSLVYNRELATSLKLAEEVVKSTRHSASKEETFTSSLTKFEKTYNEIKSSSPKQSVAVAPSKSTLPNFKITTYDNPKQKINIFEDDTIRSNNNSTVVNRNSLIDMKPESNLQKNYLGKSMENISFRKNSLEDENKKQYRYFRPPLPTTKTLHVSRSGSFSTDQTWTPSKPVTRSKSQVALNKYRDNNKSVTLLNQDNLTKSNSLFDVSGLQSLGVMRLIQNKLNTPSNSTEALDVEHEEEKEVSYQEPPEIKREVQNFEEKPKTAYQYHTPSINMGTWSERPKVPVNVKEDPDYKFSVKERTNSKLIVNTTNNDIKSHNSIEVRSAKPVLQASSYDRNVTIKVNGSEPISAQNTGNVVIKIGESVNDKPILRKPLGNINKIETRPVSARPHSIAFGGGLDISRVPIVRSVELKKPYKDLQSTNNNNNTSYTQIYQNNNGYNSLTLNRNSTYFTSNNNNNNNNNSENPSLGGLYRSTETLAKPAPPTEPKPVVRVKSFVQSSPTVRGFKPSSNNNSTELNTRQSWNQPFNYSTISNNRDYSTNKSVPFSQSNLRRTESNKNDFKTILPQKVVSQPPPPPAPSMPKLSKVTPPQPKNNFNSSNGGDSKEQLLQAIRDFGGKKGLRAVKA